MTFDPMALRYIVAILSGTAVFLLSFGIFVHWDGLSDRGRRIKLGMVPVLLSVDLLQWYGVSNNLDIAFVGGFICLGVSLLILNLTILYRFNSPTSLISRQGHRPDEPKHRGPIDPQHER